MRSHGRIVQVPPTQNDFCGGQRLPHVPQLRGSLASFTQVPPQQSLLKPTQLQALAS
jgi:hypothetical protein